MRNSIEEVEIFGKRRGMLGNLAVGFFGTQQNVRYIDCFLVVMHEKYNPIIANALAVISFPGLALEGFYVSTKGILLHLTDTAGNLSVDFGG